MGFSYNAKAQCCANNLLGDQGFETTFTANESFPDATTSPSNNARTYNNGQWFYADGANAYLPTIIDVDSLSQDGDQFGYIPDAPSTPPFNQCLGNSLSHVASLTSCGNDTYSDGLRYVISYYYVPFNKSVPSGGVGSTYPIAEFQSPFTTVYLYEDDGTAINTNETAVAWSNVATSWKRATGVTPVITDNDGITVWMSHINTSTCGLLIDNAVFEMVRVISADPKNEQAGSTASDITFTLNPESNVYGTPNIVYTVAAPAGYTISPTSGTYGQNTEFTLSINSGTMAVNGANEMTITVTDQVNTSCSVTGTVTNPHRVGVGNIIWLDEDADGVQDVGEPIFSGVDVGLYDTDGNPAEFCVNETFATDFTSVGHNSGSSNFDAAWSLSGGASVNTASGYLVIGSGDIGSRGLTTSGSVDEVSISFTVAKNGALDNTDEMLVEYYNGTSWMTIATILGSEVFGWSSFSYSSSTLAGLVDIEDIRFNDGNGVDATEIFAVDDLLISSSSCSDITTTTDATGRYWFSGVDGLQGNESYEIRIDTNQSELSGLVATVTGSGTGANDNNGTLTSTYVSSGLISTPQSGWDSTFDFGFIGYSIGNRVWWDNNDDGVIDANEHGISGVSLSLLDATGAVIATTSTDVQGYYAFHGLRSGDYQVAVTSVLNSGILDDATISSTTNTTEDIDINNDGSTTDPAGNTAISFSSISDMITLGGHTEPTNEQEEDVNSNQPDDQSNLSIDFGFAPPTTAVGNFVFHDVNNDGDFDSGTDSALTSIMMVLLIDSDGDGTPETTIDSIQTDASGHYMFDSLGAGTYQIAVSSTNFQSGGPLSTGIATNNGSSGDGTTDMNSEGLISGIFNVAPNSENTADANDGALAGIDDDDANFSFDFGFFGSGGGPVPVELISFNGLRKENDVVLEWVTASEVSSDYVHIERSYDSDLFEVVGYKQSAGQSQSVLSYDFVDVLVPKVTLYYRLKFVDFDGTYEYSKIVALDNKDLQSYLKVYPVPANNEINVSSDFEGLIKAELYSNTGSLIKSKEFDSQLKMDIRDLPLGVYYLKLNDEYVKFIKTK